MAGTNLKFYIVKSDIRISDKMLIMTRKKSLAIDSAADYIINNNIGCDKAWNDLNQFEIEGSTYHKSREDFILYLCNQEFITSPVFQEIFIKGTVG
jgi:hypothetical protein